MGSTPSNHWFFASFNFTLIVGKFIVIVSSVSSALSHNGDNPFLSSLAAVAKSTWRTFLFFFVSPSIARHGGHWAERSFSFSTRPAVWGMTRCDGSFSEHVWFVISVGDTL